ncbi:AAA family ATPase [Sphingobacterium sp. BIGb0116]|uniref:AAA family ATPase n=1 Tax=Sphingobacterium sp. BIGb0116 TaxID=2940619 RepID=UPI002168F5C4|nr:ATP-binding protein [Sphingobacterium sp. BIGb0116]MCS4163791.1 SpoVK/Ycf46/Vps4 family AAA+-type ATPase [Sphingobacterium sp. BIGb0116]
MAALEQIKSLIRSFGEGDESRFYATAMQIAAAEARQGHTVLAEELKKMIDKAKLSKSKESVLIKKLPVNSAQKELDDLLELVRPEVKLKDMVLSKNVRNSIQRVLDEQRKIDILESHGLTARRKLLFTGAPGCGKTMSAHVLASELGLPLFIIRLDGLISRYMGESIAKLRLVFDAMRDFRAVYLFDEFDSIGTSRSAGNEVGEIKRVLNSFLLQIEKDDSRSLIIAATNLPESLDVALFRRFDDIIQFPLPTEEDIYQLFDLEFTGFDLPSTIDLRKVTHKAIGLSFADIHRIVSDVWKDYLVYGDKNVSEEKILHYVEGRKRPF